MDNGKGSCVDVLPIDCKTSAERIIVSTYNIKGVVFNSLDHIKAAAQMLDMNSGRDLARLMAICIEVGAVIKTANAREFYRAMIGIGVVEYTGQNIGYKANVIYKMLHGYNHKVASGMNHLNGLSEKHYHWSTQDQAVGNSLFEIMKSNLN